MSPEEIRQIVDSVVADKLVAPYRHFVVLFLIPALAAFLGAYFSTKGKNLATKEDTGRITHEVESAKAAIRALDWPVDLKRQLEKTRGIERQELRYKSYGLLWKELKPLALYADTRLDKATALRLSTSLTSWYFSEHGGLLLTSQARDFYFALQELLQSTARIAEPWQAIRTEGDQKQLFRDLLKQRSVGMLEVLDYLKEQRYENWNEKAIGFGETWRKGINGLAERWATLEEKDRFTVLQQVGSTLRTCLVIDLESRLL